MVQVDFEKVRRCKKVREFLFGKIPDVQYAEWYFSMTAVFLNSIFDLLTGQRVTCAIFNAIRIHVSIRLSCELSNFGKRDATDRLWNERDKIVEVKCTAGTAPCFRGTPKHLDMVKIAMIFWIIIDQQPAFRNSFFKPFPLLGKIRLLR